MKATPRRMKRTPRHRSPEATRDALARSEYLHDARVTMEEKDDFADRMRQKYGKNAVQTFHRGLWADFSIHDYGGPGLHLRVHARREAEGTVDPGKPQRVLYRIEVTGNGDLTEREAARLVHLLMVSHRQQFPREEKKNGAT